MPQSRDNQQGPRHGDSMDAVALNRTLSRKVTFWRRAAWLVLGGAAVFGMVFYSRGETRRRECRESLAHYADIAAKVRLFDEDPAILEKQWDQFEQPPNNNSPLHYDLIVRNWIRQPKPGDAVPLAVCRDRHITSLSVGRHVLMNTPNGYKVVWIKDEDALSYLKDARQDNR